MDVTSISQVLNILQNYQTIRFIQVVPATFMVYDCVSDLGVSSEDQLCLEEKIVKHLSRLPDLSNAFPILAMCMNCLSVWFVQVILGLRLYALYNGSRRVLLAIGIGFIAEFVVMIARKVYVNYGTIVVYEIILFSLAVSAAVRRYREKPGPSPVNRRGAKRLADILIEGNVVYFLANTLYAVFYFVHPSYEPVLEYLHHTMSSHDVANRSARDRVIGVPFPEFDACCGERAYMHPVSSKAFVTVDDAVGSTMNVAIPTLSTPIDLTTDTASYALVEPWLYIFYKKEGKTAKRLGGAYIAVHNTSHATLPRLERCEALVKRAVSHDLKSFRFVGHPNFCESTLATARMSALVACVLGREDSKSFIFGDVSSLPQLRKPGRIPREERRAPRSFVEASLRQSGSGLWSDRAATNAWPNERARLIPAIVAYNNRALDAPRELALQGKKPYEMKIHSPAGFWRRDDIQFG
ncbi:hypothetical protein EDD15DRAFT_2200243 [Pisolithus albus]|nr:hypothetical protein EDD15DRAFT_2200243 [Pisolithus albus]